MKHPFCKLCERLHHSGYLRDDIGLNPACTKILTHGHDPLNLGYKDLIEADLVIASGIVEGAARYVVGERLDCSGMRWIPERAEALLHLRCIELNGDWERFFAWGYQRWLDQMRAGQRVMIRTDQADALPTAESMEAMDTQAHHDANPPIAA